MTLLILASGFDLCTDPDSCNNSEATEISEGGQQTKPELCGPFCQCVRCPFSVLIPKTITATEKLFFARRNFPCPSPGTPVKISSSIWQPPKVT